MTESLRDLKFPLVCQRTLIVLPFSYADGTGRATVSASPRWKRRRFDMSVESDAERTRYLVPYIRRFLFPEADPQRSPATACQRFELDFTIAGVERSGVDRADRGLSGRHRPRDSQSQRGLWRRSLGLQPAADSGRGRLGPVRPLRSLYSASAPRPALNLRDGIPRIHSACFFDFFPPAIFLAAPFPAALFFGAAVAED